MSNIQLRHLVYDWIQNDPTLKQHITLSYWDDGFFIETKCGGRFTMAWVNDKKNEMTVSPNVWEQGHDIDIDRCVYLNPADPNYFEQLNEACRRWHNSYSTYVYGCQQVL